MDKNTTLYIYIVTTDVSFTINMHNVCNLKEFKYKYILRHIKLHAFIGEI